ncbi:MAG: hypothetical protein WC382_04595 [Methanoregulaceae archaeon]|jgi:hypothetical protein
MTDSKFRPILMFCFLAGLFVLVFPVCAWCNDIPAGTLIESNSFRTALDVTDGGRLALAGKGFPGTNGLLEMNDEILGEIAADSNYADLILYGFILELSNDDGNKYYEIFPGASGYKEIEQIQDDQGISAISSMTALSLAFRNGIPEGVLKLHPGIDRFGVEGFSPGSLSIPETIQSVRQHDIRSTGDLGLTSFGINGRLSLTETVQGSNYPGYNSYGEGVNMGGSKEAFISRLGQDTVD